jgi:hypothetical protein
MGLETASFSMSFGQDSADTIRTDRFKASLSRTWLAEVGEGVTGRLGGLDTVEAIDLC